jgi:hypothetical protein
MLRQITKSSFLLTFLVIACLLSGCKKDEMSTPNFTLPEVKTVEIFQIGRLFKCRGQILSDSSSPIIERGICYDTFPFPTTTNSFKKFSDIDFNLKDKDNTHFFTIKLKGLKDETTYYVRAYALTKDGISYGEVLKFKTEPLSKLMVGDDLDGGKVGYILKPGDKGYIEGENHGIIVAANDLDGKYIWGGYYYDYLGAGKLNTEIHFNPSVQKENAASICNDLELNGYSDWYLPCRTEYCLVLPNMEVIGNFKDGCYWSSTHTASSGNPFADPEFGYCFSLKIKLSHYSIYEWLGDEYKFWVRPIRYF